MNPVIIDRELQIRLNGLDKHTTFCDEAGNPLGFFIPAAAGKARLAALKIPFSKEEMQRRMQEKGGSTLEEIWQRLGRS